MGKDRPLPETYAGYLVFKANGAPVSQSFGESEKISIANFLREMKLTVDKTGGIRAWSWWKAQGYEVKEVRIVVLNEVN